MTNQEIVEGLKRSEPRVYDYLYRVYGGKVASFVLQKGGTLDDAKDVMQETLLKLPKSILTYKEESRFAQWFITIAGNTWMQILRDEKKHAAAPVDAFFDLKDEGEESLERVLVKEQKYAILFSLLEDLGEMCAAILRSFYLGGSSSKDLAELYDINDNAMRGRIKQCRDKLTERSLAMLEKLGL